MRTLKFSGIAAVALTLSLGITSGWAGDLTASSSSPSVFFDDTDHPNAYEWYIESITDGSTSVWGVHSYMNGVDSRPIGIAQGNNANSLGIHSNGDIQLGDYTVFIDKSNGFMGIGTDKPESSLHAKGNGNLILEGGSYSKWQLGTTQGGGLLLQDMIAGTEPFVIDGNAPTKTLHVNNQGDVGIGINHTGSFVPPLHAKLDVNGSVFSNDGYRSSWEGYNETGDGLTNLMVLSANNSFSPNTNTEPPYGDYVSDVGFALENARAGIQWNFRTHQDGTAFVATLQGTGGAEFTVKNATSNVSGTELYLGNGAKNVGGLWINASSRALKENIKELNTQDALAAFHKLQPVTYNYKSDKKEQVVGFIAEDVPELVAIQSRDGLSAMDMVAVLTKVVQEQDKVMAKTRTELKKAQEKIAKQDTKITKLETMQKKVAQLESILTNLALDTSKTQKEKVSLKLK